MAAVPGGTARGMGVGRAGRHHGCRPRPPQRLRRRWQAAAAALAAAATGSLGGPPPAFLPAAARTLPTGLGGHSAGAAAAAGRRPPPAASWLLSLGPGAALADEDDARATLTWLNNLVVYGPLFSLFVIVGLGFVGGYVLGIFVPPGEGDYGDERLAMEREARARGWKRDMTGGYDEATAVKLLGMSTMDPDFVPVPPVIFMSSKPGQQASS
ncbi:unnamed protein product [Prorocentrum cordatum]|uniref:Uncharacterized protein n=1 Tax=Prorocentrum cordatum TaxID=2364126 RepID=A0ABN9THH3_9DINO|nr:unnamed protein product [Polarella glacialis]